MRSVREPQRTWRKQLDKTTILPSTNSVPQRFTCLEHMLNPFLGFLVAEQPQERIAFEIENVLLCRLAPAAIAAGEHVRDLVRETHLVVRDLTRLAHRERGVM